MEKTKEPDRTSRIPNPLTLPHYFARLSIVYFRKWLFMPLNAKNSFENIYQSINKE